MHAFWFHYNRPASQQAGAAKLTVHYKGECHIVDDVICGVAVSSRRRRSQPRLVMAGRGVVRIRDGVARITEV
jgi:hypothetical protein